MLGTEDPRNHKRHRLVIRVSKGQKSEHLVLAGSLVLINSPIYTVPFNIYTKYLAQWGSKNCPYRHSREFLLL